MDITHDEVEALIIRICDELEEHGRFSPFLSLSRGLYYVNCTWGHNYSIDLSDIYVDSVITRICRIESREAGWALKLPAYYKIWELNYIYDVIYDFANHNIDIALLRRRALELLETRFPMERPWMSYYVPQEKLPYLEEVKERYQEFTLGPTWVLSQSGLFAPSPPRYFVSNCDYVQRLRNKWEMSLHDSSPNLWNEYVTLGITEWFSFEFSHDRLVVLMKRYLNILTLRSVLY